MESWFRGLNIEQIREQIYHVEDEIQKTAYALMALGCTRRMLQKALVDHEWLSKGDADEHLQ